ncbi:MAG: hypothetical protein DI629_18970, partial [Mesorhizobium amorphae]
HRRGSGAPTVRVAVMKIDFEALMSYLALAPGGVLTINDAQGPVFDLIAGEGPVARADDHGPSPFAEERPVTAPDGEPRDGRAEIADAIRALAGNVLLAAEQISLAFRGGDDLLTVAQKGEVRTFEIADRLPADEPDVPLTSPETTTSAAVSGDQLLRPEGEDHHAPQAVSLSSLFDDDDPAAPAEGEDSIIRRAFAGPAPGREEGTDGFSSGLFDVDHAPARGAGEDA